MSSNATAGLARHGSSHCVNLAFRHELCHLQKHISSVHYAKIQNQVLMSCSCIAPAMAHFLPTRSLLDSAKWSALTWFAAELVPCYRQELCFTGRQHFWHICWDTQKR